MKITVLKKETKRGLGELNELIEQLRGERFNRAGTMRELHAILSDKNISMVVAKDKGRIVGVVTLYKIPKIGKNTAHVEDVVVHSEYRGKGIGEQLMRAVIKNARKKKIQGIKLTSRPEREIANKLYQKVGFKLKKTNPYRIEL